MFINSGYLGYPVALFALGEAGLQNAVIFDGFVTVLHFTLGVFLVHPEEMHWKEKVVGILKLPLIYAITIGIGLNFSGVVLPELLVSFLTLIGAATIPLALLALGGRLATIKAGNLKVPLIAIFIRFVMGTAAALVFIKLFNAEGIVASSILLLSIMPPAVNSYVLNEKFSKDPENAATAVLIGTLLGIIPIAIVLSLI